MEDLAVQRGNMTKVILYSTGCPKCRILKMMLDNNNIKYIENNNKTEMIEKGLSSVPALEVDGELFNYEDAVKIIREGKLMGTNEIK